MNEILTISSDLRTITPSGPFLLGVYNDTNVHTLSFSIPRYYGSEDFGEYTIKINVLNATGEIEADEADNIVVGEDTITFDWVMKRFVFAEEGTVRFNIALAMSNPVKRFHTSIYRGLVLPGLETDDVSIQSVLYRLELLRDTAAESEDLEVTVGVETFTANQLNELVNYLNT